MLRNLIRNWGFAIGHTTQTWKTWACFCRICCSESTHQTQIIRKHDVLERSHVIMTCDHEQNAPSSVSRDLGRTQSRICCPGVTKRFLSCRLSGQRAHAQRPCGKVRTKSSSTSWQSLRNVFANIPNKMKSLSPRQNIRRKRNSKSHLACPESVVSRCMFELICVVKSARPDTCVEHLRTPFFEN